jgi:hypothetical protein
MSQHDQTDGKNPVGPEPDEPASPEELAQAQALRNALEGRGQHALADLAQALRMAVKPQDIDAREHEQLVQRAVARKSGAERRVIYVAFAATSALALAAAVTLLLSRAQSEQPLAGLDMVQMGAAGLARSRSTQPLFDAPFAPHGGSSARIDRIAQQRSKDYRANLFAKLGVR